MWPVNLDLGGTVLEYSTAQLLCRLGELNTYVFFAWPSLPVEFAFESTANEIIEAPHARIERKNRLLFVEGVEPGKEAAIRIRKPGEQEIQILLLTREMARDAWKAKLAGRERLLLSAANLCFTSGAIHFSTSKPEELAFEILPKPLAPPRGFTASGSQGLFERYQTQVRQEKISATVEKLQDADLQPPVRLGKEVAEAPETEAFKGAAEWSIQIPPLTSPAVREVSLRITYIGDIARVLADGKLLTDDFYNGTPWPIAWRYFLPQEAGSILKLQILPIRKDTPIYLPGQCHIAYPLSGQVAELKEVEVVPEYHAVAEWGN